MRSDRRANDVIGIVTLVTQSRSASFVASLRVRDAEGHRHLGRTEQVHAKTLGRLPLDIDLAHVDDAVRARIGPHTVAVATPCCPAPVSAMIRRFPIRRASST